MLDFNQMQLASSPGTDFLTSLFKVLCLVSFWIPYIFSKGGLAIATALLTGLLAAGFGRRNSNEFFHQFLIFHFQMATLPPPFPAWSLLPLPHLSRSHPAPSPTHPAHGTDHSWEVLCSRHNLPSLPLLIRACPHLLESTQPCLLLLSGRCRQPDSSPPYQDRPPPPGHSSCRPRSAGVVSGRPSPSPAGHR